MSLENLNHLLVRKDHVVCTRCYTNEPVNPGKGTPMSTLVKAYELMALRHTHCGGK